MAKEAVPLIYKIWQEHYSKKNRRPKDGYSAYEIAAHYMDAEPADVEKKPSGKHKKPRKPRAK
jgi:hypothetical protein